MGRAGKGKQAEERPKDDDDALLDAAIAENKATQKMKAQQPPEQKERGKEPAAAPGKAALTKQEIIEAATAAGRDASQMTWSTRVEVEVHGKPSSDRNSSRTTLPGNDPAMMVANIKAFQDAGVDHIVLALNSGDVSALKRLMKTISAEVLTEFK